jgi:hypothetical protein
MLVLLALIFSVALLVAAFSKPSRRKESLDLQAKAASESTINICVTLQVPPGAEVPSSGILQIPGIDLSALGASGPLLLAAEIVAPEAMKLVRQTPIQIGRKKK